MTKRSTWDGATVVYRYGCPSWADLDDEGMAQLRLAHDLRNELVAIERRYEAMHAAIWLSFPDVADAQETFDAAIVAVERAEQDMRATRVHNRSTTPAVVESVALTEAKSVRRQAAQHVKAVKTRLRPLMREQRAELDAAKRYAMSKENLYRDWVQTRGLGWATYTDVLDRHRVAAVRVGQARKAGRPAQLRFRPWVGDGTITVQVQRRTDGRLREQWQLRAARPAATWCGRARRVAEQTSAHGRCMLWLQVGRSRSFGPLELELPVVAHRPVPAWAEVTYVRVTRRMVSGRPRLSVSLTAREPAPQPQSGMPVSVLFGWTGIGAGAVRVARVSTPFGVLADPPASLTARPFAGVLAPGPEWVDVHAPAEWRILLEHADAIRSRRAELLDELRPGVVEALADEVLADRTGFTAVQAQVMKFAKYDRLTRTWPAGHVTDPVAHAGLLDILVRHHPEERLAGLSTLELWRMRDRHLWAYEANERDQIIARRRDAWRKVADWICSQASEVLLDFPPVAELRQRPPVDAEDDYQTRGARRSAQFAAPGDLRAAIAVAASRRGVKVIDVRGETDGGT